LQPTQGDLQNSLASSSLLTVKTGSARGITFPFVPFFQKVRVPSAQMSMIHGRL
jgi:hypothetical protein